MAEEIGTVVESSADEIVVEFSRSAACRNCTVSGLCLPIGSEQSRLRLPASGFESAAGRTVRVRLPEKTVIWGSFIVFIWPILALIGAALLGYLTADRLGVGGAAETIAVVAGLAGLGLSFLLIALYDRRLKKSHRFRPEIVELIE